MSLEFVYGHRITDVIEFHCQEFNIPATDTYPQELITLAKVDGIPRVVFYAGSMDEPTIIPIKDITLDTKACLIGLDEVSKYVPEIKGSRIISNFENSQNAGDSNSHEEICIVAASALYVLKAAQNNLANVSYPQRQAIINGALLLLKQMFPNLLYAAIKTTDNGSELWLFLYLDKTKPHQLN